MKRRDAGVETRGLMVDFPASFDSMQPATHAGVWWGRGSRTGVKQGSSSQWDISGALGIALSQGLCGSCSGCLLIGGPDITQLFCATRQRPHPQQTGPHPMLTLEAEALIVQRRQYHH